MAKNACCVWDLVIPEKAIKLDNLKTWLKDVAKCWCFQLEKGEKTGYEHYQIRLSLKQKSRQCPTPVKEAHYCPTSDANKDNQFYVMKAETRIKGPWTDADEEVYIPRQFRGLLEKLTPWQKYVIESRETFDTRSINLIFDPIGNKGKSTLASLGEIHYGGFVCPQINDHKELMQAVCNHYMDHNIRDSRLLFIDLPRAYDKSNLGNMMAAIETIKNGKLYDLRYHSKTWWIDSPTIWIFTNMEPNLEHFSKDRWKIWVINAHLELIPLNEAIKD